MNSGKCPTVSVIMPVFNCDPYINEAIDSILNQTFVDFELIIIDDGSTDKTYDFLLSIDDPRIRLVRNTTNFGIVTSLNRGIELARGEYIARMDGDDIAFPERFAKQVARMESDLTLGVCGTWVITIGESPGQLWKNPIRHDDIEAELIFNSAVYHPTVFLRRSIIEKFNIFYSSEFPFAKFLWSRLVKITKVENLNEPLVYYRIHSIQTGKN